MSTTERPLVLVFGATGGTGKSIVNGLLGAGTFRVAAAIRPSSLSKPAVETLRAKGVEIRVGDLSDGVEALTKILEGVNIVISAVDARVITQQQDLVRAAKAAGVQQLVPCDFGTPGAKGVRRLHDAKLEIRDYIKELGVPHTFIDVGWWMQLLQPIPLRSRSQESTKKMTWQLVGTGDERVLVTDRERIGVYVARVVADPRTLNQAVIVWEDEVSQNDAHAIGERLSGEGDRLKAQRIYVTREDLLAAIAAGEEQIKKNPADFGGHVAVSWTEYQISMFVLQENTLENAKKLGYLDVRELYPDIVPRSLERYAEQLYSLEDPGKELPYEF